MTIKTFLLLYSKVKYQQQWIKLQRELFWTVPSHMFHTKEYYVYTQTHSCRHTYIWFEYNPRHILLKPRGHVGSTSPPPHLSTPFIFEMSEKERKIIIALQVSKWISIFEMKFFFRFKIIQLTISGVANSWPNTAICNIRVQLNKQQTIIVINIR